MGTSVRLSAGEALRKSSWIAGALVVLGTTQILGGIFSNQTLVKFGRISALAPLPTVFSSYGGVDYWASSLWLEATSATGERRQRKFDAEFFAEINPHHTIGILRLTLLSLGPLANPIWTRNLLHEGFCVSEDFSRAMRLGNVESYRVRLVDSKNIPRWNIQGRCR